MRVDLHPPWQYSVYRPTMALVGTVFPAYKSRRSGIAPYPQRFSAMRGLVPADMRRLAAESPQGCVWVHGVSVGEALAAAPLIEWWQQQGPADIPMVFSTTTNGGYKLATQKLPAGTPITFFPFDAPGPMGRFFDALRPCALVLYETELWPTLIAEARRRDIPLLLANARISDRTAQPPAVARPLIAWMLQQFTAIKPQSPLDERRLRTFGVRDEQLLPVGNVKFDAAGSPPTPEERIALRGTLGISHDTPVFVAGSTHAGEETIVLEALSRVRIAKRDLVAILAPRHLERLPEVRALLESRDVPFICLSELRTNGPHVETPPTILVDTLGDLVSLYGIADCAFVGGSLIPRGGHNLLEPAAQGCPVLHGPSMENFRAITELLTMNGVAQLVTAESLAHHMREILGNEYERKEWRTRLAATVDAHRGATRQIGEWLAEHLKSNRAAN